MAAAGPFGINAEIHSTQDYAKTQRWASRLAVAGFDGIRYFLCSDRAQRLIGFALFHPEGVPAAGAWPAPLSTGPAPDQTAAEARSYGLKVLPTP